MSGWEIYKASGYEATLVEINDELSARGLPPVSSRMYVHYRKMRRYGYEQYLPINQLDVCTMEDPIWDRTLRGRYPMYAVLPFKRLSGSSCWSRTNRRLSQGSSKW